MLATSSGSAAPRPPPPLLWHTRTSRAPRCSWRCADTTSPRRHPASARTECADAPPLRHCTLAQALITSAAPPPRARDGAPLDRAPPATVRPAESAGAGGRCAMRRCRLLPQSSAERASAPLPVGTGKDAGVVPRLGEVRQRLEGDVMAERIAATTRALEDWGVAHRISVLKRRAAAKADAKMYQCRAMRPPPPQPRGRAPEYFTSAPQPPQYLNGTAEEKEEEQGEDEKEGDELGATPKAAERPVRPLWDSGGAMPESEVEVAVPGRSGGRSAPRVQQWRLALVDHLIALEEAAAAAATATPGNGRGSASGKTRVRATETSSVAGSTRVFHRSHPFELLDRHLLQAWMHRNVVWEQRLAAHFSEERRTARGDVGGDSSGSGHDAFGDAADAAAQCQRGRARHATLREVFSDGSDTAQRLADAFQITTMLREERRRRARRQSAFISSEGSAGRTAQDDSPAAASTPPPSQPPLSSSSSSPSAAAALARRMRAVVVDLDSLAAQGHAAVAAATTVTPAGWQADSGGGGAANCSFAASPASETTTTATRFAVAGGGEDGRFISATCRFPKF